MTQPAPTPVRRPRVVLAMDERTRRALLPDRLVARLSAVADVDVTRAVTNLSDPDSTTDVATELATDLADAEILLTSWGAPLIDDAALRHMPRLTAIVHAAGSVKTLVTPAVFDRGIVVTSAADANAVPVAEFTFAAIILAAKRVTRFVHAHREHPLLGAWDLPVDDVGMFGRTVGVVGASRIGRRVLRMLENLDVTVLLADPTVTAEQAAALGAELMDVDELCRRSDIVSLHAPALPSTRHLLDARRLSLLPDGATVINTARGALIDTAALTVEIVSGRIDAILDVTDPEPLDPASPLYSAPNAILTPHIAGSLGREVERLGESAIGEIERFARGLPPVAPVRFDEWERMA